MAMFSLESNAVCFQITTPMPMMLWVASIVEGVIENYVDMGILLGIQASSIATQISTADYSPV